MAVADSQSTNDSSAQDNHATNANLHSNIYQHMGNNNPLFMNPHAVSVAQAATAALAAAAQQVAQQASSNPNTSQGLTFPSNKLAVQSNTSDSNTSINGNKVSQQTNHNQAGSQSKNPTPNKLNGNMTSLSEAVPVAPMVQNPQVAQAFANPQQMALNAQAAAALLATGGINPALLLGSGGVTPAATTIAAAFSLLQPQQQPQAASTANHNYQEQQNTSGATSSDNANTSHSKTLIQHFNHGTPAQSALLNGRNQEINTMANGNDSLSSLISYNVAAQQRAKKGNQNVTTHIHNTNASTAQPTQQQPPTHVNSLYAAASNNPVFFAQMQNWKLEQLDSHCRLLRETNQPIPQPVSLLLAEARRREEKRTAKRVANRKSACTSRARKKAFVEEMTRTNARLRRQAIILSLLPDLVIAIKLNGEITFCSAQVGRVLRHSVDNLVGAKINDILVPSSRKELSRLIEKLAAAEKAALDENNKEVDESGRSSNSGNQSTTAVVSEQSDQGFPPLSVVKVKSCSSVTSCYKSSGEIPRSHADDVIGASVTANNAGARLSSLQHSPGKKKHTDDVTGASVTANNAGARLSSLQHKPDGKKSSKSSGNNFESQEDVASSTSTDSLFAGVEDKRKVARGNDNENISDDSGYRESGESAMREDSSSTSDTSNGGRPRPLAPTCNICLIRNDLSTIWCEVTSSIRTRSLNEENSETVVTSGPQSLKKKEISANTSNSVELASDNSQNEQVKELLLCLRPIRDGDNKIGSKFKFIPVVKSGQDTVPGSNDIASAQNVTIIKGTTSSTEAIKKRPMKKRPLPNSDLSEPQKRPALEKSGSEAEKSVVESLILMSGNVHKN